ncbi:MAG: hypothetical protein EOM15_05145 [Spirochaetia bacterium]|nr:hypothetical protein [Spirochaetia bacterium]
MHRSRVFIIILGVSILTSCTTTRANPSFGVLVETEKELQTMHHFGASAAWWAQEVGSWPQPQLNEIMDLLYDQTVGIALQVIRYNLGGGKENSTISDPLRKAHSLETSPGNFNSENDAFAIRVIDEAVSRNAKVIVFANSPPARLTVTQAPTGRGYLTNLQEGKEDAFAEYLVNASDYLYSEKKWPILDISPMNEPQWDWSVEKNQEGCFYSPEQAKVVTEALASLLEASDFRFGISVIDSGEMKLRSNSPYLEALFKNSELSDSLTHYAVHSYWSTAFEKQRLRQYMDQNYPSVELWMTEWTQMKQGRDYGMDSALELSQIIWEDVTYAQVSSWQYWIALSPYEYHDGLIYYDSSDTSFTVTKRLWALGNWSKFIKPGARMLSVTQDAEVSILSSGWKNLDGSIVCVFTNRTGQAYESSIQFDKSEYESMAVYVTDERHDLVCTYEGNLKNFEILPMSVTTVMYQ